MSDAVGLSVRDVVRQLLANQWSPLRHEGARLGDAESAAARFLSGLQPLCSHESDLLPLHPVLAQEFGRESTLLRALATRDPLVRLGANLAEIGPMFPARQDGDAAMAAVLGEVIEGLVVAAVGLDAAFEYMTACLS